MKFELDDETLDVIAAKACKDPGFAVAAAILTLASHVHAVSDELERITIIFSEVGPELNQQLREMSQRI